MIGLGGLIQRYRLAFVSVMALLVVGLMVIMGADDDLGAATKDAGAHVRAPVAGGNGNAAITGHQRSIVRDAGTDRQERSSTNVGDREIIDEQACASAPDGMVLIPGGTFLMGDSFGDDGWDDELPCHSVYVSGFFMDRFEVSKQLWDEVRGWGTDHGYDLTIGEGKCPDHPVHSVSWYDVVKWCNARSEMEKLTPCYYTTDLHTVVYRTGELDITNNSVRWDENGYRLPTEAEWEKAARNGLEGKRFPWGDTISHSQANYYSVSDYSYDVSPTRGYHPDYYSGGYPYTSPVGSFPPNGYGLYDMTGNLWEWCWDWDDWDWYKQSDASQPDPMGPDKGARRVFRGGGWRQYPIIVRCANRGRFSPDNRDNGYGFRCARGQS